MKKIISMVIVLLLVLCLFPLSAFAADYTISESGTYTMSAEGYASGDRVTIAGGLTVTLIGDSATTYTDFSISCGAGTTLTISNINIDDSANDGVCPLAFTGTGNTLTLADGTVSTLKGGANSAGVFAASGTELTITGAGTINATGGSYSAGIGGSNGGGTVTITGGTVNATGGGSGAGIGGGYHGNSEVTISGGTVNATGGNASAGIGGGRAGAGMVTISGGTVNATGGSGGAGIGSGNVGSSPTTVNISSGTVTATGGVGGAGIGGGQDSSATVNISGGTVNATGGGQGAGIGGGNKSNGIITISGGVVIANGGSGGAGIGKASNSSASGTVSITGGTVFAGYGSGGTKDIDSGTAGSDNSMTISDTAAVFLQHDSITPPTTTTHAHFNYDAGTAAVNGISIPPAWTGAFGAYLRAFNANITASGTYRMSDDLGLESGDTVTIAPGLTVTLIGDSATTYTDFSISCGAGTALTLSNVNIDDSANDGVCPLAFTGSGNTLTLADGTVSTLKGGLNSAGVSVGDGNELTITGAGTIDATGGSNGAGIGGSNGGGGTVNISSGTVNATGGKFGAGIGGGTGGGGTVNISGGNVTANSVQLGAGIGGGNRAPGFVNISGGKVNATGGVSGAAIGGCNQDGIVTISGGTVNATGGSMSAGIGGSGNYNGMVTISGGTVTVTGGNNGPGIGRGRYGSNSTVNISGGTVFAAYGSSEYRDIDGGTTGSVTISDTAAVFMQHDTYTTITTATHEHYNFDAGTAAAYGISMPSAWTEAFGAYLRVCTLTYDANGGSGAPAAVSQLYGATANIAAKGSMANGNYTFKGWNTVAVGGGTAYQAGDVYTLTNSETLFAQWGGIVVTVVSGDTSRGSVSGGGEYEPGTSVTVSASVNSGYYFVGWYNGDTLVSSDASYTFTAGADVTLTAQFGESVTVTVVSSNVAYGSISGGGSFTPGASVTVTATAITGYNFVGWYNGTTLVSSDASYTFTASESVTLTAKFVENVTITVVSSNVAYGSVSGGGSFTPGASVTVTATAKTGYSFAGWYNGATLVSSDASYTFTASESITLAAQFTAENAKVTITAVSGNSAYGSVSGGGSYNPGASVTLKATAKSGYYFAGWYQDGNLVFSSASYTFAAASSLTFTAQFDTVGIPQTITATATAYNKITVKWSAAGGAKGYGVYRATAEDGPYTLITTVTSTSYADPVNVGATYYYKVRGYRLSGFTKVYSNYYSDTVSATTELGQVTGVKAASSDPTSVKITWNSVCGATKYEVWRAATQNGDYSLVTTTSCLSFTDTGLTTDSTYYYKVVAYATVGGSKVYGDFSSPQAVTPTVAKVNRVKASKAGSSQVRISWCAVAGAAKYEIWVSNTQNGTYTLLGETSSTSYVDNTKSTRYYKVRAYNIVLNTKHYGDYSSVVHP